MNISDYNDEYLKFQKQMKKDLFLEDNQVNLYRFQDNNNLNHQAIVHIKEENLQEARICSLRSIEIRPNDVFANFLAGASLANQKNYSESDKYFGNVIDLAANQMENNYSNGFLAKMTEIESLKISNEKIDLENFSLMLLSENAKKCRELINDNKLFKIIMNKRIEDRFPSKKTKTKKK